MTLIRKTQAGGLLALHPGAGAGGVYGDQVPDRGLPLAVTARHVPSASASVPHAYPVPPVAELIAISTGDHPAEPGQRPYNRLSFTFTTAFPNPPVQPAIRDPGYRGGKGHQPGPASLHCRL